MAQPTRTGTKHTARPASREAAAASGGLAARAYFRVEEVRPSWSGGPPDAAEERSADLEVATLVPTAAPADAEAAAVVVFPGPLVLHVPRGRGRERLRAGQVVELSFGLAWGR